MAALGDSDGFLMIEDLFNYFKTLENFEQQWQNIGEQDIRNLRIRCADLLQEELWQHAYSILKDEPDDAKFIQYGPQLFGEIKSFYEQLCMKTEDTVHLYFLQEELKKYEDVERTIKMLIAFLKEEKELAVSFQNPDQQMDTSDLPLVTQLMYSLEENVKILQSERRRLGKLTRDVFELHDTYKAKQERLQAGISQMCVNGINPEVLKQELSNISETLKKTEGDRLCVENGIPQTVHQINEISGLLLKTLEEDIRKWKKEQQDYYVDLLPDKPVIDITQQKCSKVGKVLWDCILHELEPLKMEINNKDIADFLQESTQQIFKRFKDFLQKSFLVTDQVHHMVKVEMGAKKRNQEDDDGSSGDGSGKKKFKCPRMKATVRLVAGDNFECKEKVKAMFCKEDDIGEIKVGFDWRSLENKSLASFPLEPKGAESQFEKKCAVAYFRNLELTKFTRNNEKAVAEEKYRLIFKTIVRLAGDREIHLWTMSLPIVVITGASQSCNAYGSLLYQCCAVEDAFAAVPPLCPPSMKWFEVCDMLSRKIRVLGDRDLTHEELKHIGHRIMGTPVDVDPDAPIELRKICADKMMDIGGGKEWDDKKKSATFWMWFQAVFNLLKNYLKIYWNENLIQGFLDKDMSQRKLLSCKPNTFLLRFSDSSITDGQGQSMCGAISASFVYQDDSGKKQVEHAAPFTAEDLKKKGLARLLGKVVCRETKKGMLEWLFPGDKTREMAFKNFDVPDPKKGSRDYTEFEILLEVKCKMRNMSLEDDTAEQDHKVTNSKGIRPKAIAKKRHTKERSKTIESKHAKHSEVESVPDVDFLTDVSGISNFDMETKQETKPDLSHPGNIPTILDLAQEQNCDASTKALFDPNQVTSSQPGQISFPLQHPNISDQQKLHPALADRLKAHHQPIQSLLANQSQQKISGTTQERLKTKINQQTRSYSHNQGRVLYNVGTGIANKKERDMNTYSHKSPTHISGGNFGGPAMVEIKPGIMDLPIQIKNTGGLVLNTTDNPGITAIQEVETGNVFLQLGGNAGGSPVSSNGSPALPDSTCSDERELTEENSQSPQGNVLVIQNDMMSVPVMNSLPDMSNVIVTPVTMAPLDSSSSSANIDTSGSSDMSMLIEHVISTSPSDGESITADFDMSYFDISGSGSGSGSGSSGGNHTSA